MIDALGSNPTEKAVTEAEAAYDALEQAQKDIVDAANMDKLQAFLGDISNGKTLQGEIADASTVGAIKKLRADYNKLGNLGKAKVKESEIVAKETALADAKTALANAISTAEGLYAKENTRLDKFSAADITSINEGTAGTFEAYVKAVRTTFKGAIDTATKIKVDDDATKLSDIDASTLNSAISEFNSAKSTFDALDAVKATGK